MKILYLIHLIRFFLPVAVLTGLWTSFWNVRSFKPSPLPSPAGSGEGEGVTFLAGFGGVVSGVFIYALASQFKIFAQVETFLYALNLFFVILTGVFSGGTIVSRANILLSSGRSSSRLFIGSFTALSVVQFLKLISSEIFSSISVINTDLALNCLSLIAGVIFVIWTASLSSFLSRRVTKKILFVLLAVLFLNLTLNWGVEIILKMMRFGVLQNSGLLLALVAKYKYFSPMAIYLYIAVLGLLLGFCLIQKRKGAKDDLVLTPVEKRKELHRTDVNRRWFLGSFISVFFLLSIFMYYDLYATAPLKFSTPLLVKPDSQGLIRLNLDEFIDGKLRRFGWMTEDGRLVRFFAINRSPDSKDVTVVLDTCLMCKFTAYIQKKNHVICRACNARIFIPSIGRFGGCNPIPLAHRIEAGEILVLSEDLRKEASYFPQVHPKGGV